MSLMASQITSLTIVYSTVYSGADQRKHQRSASLAFVTGEFSAQKANNASIQIRNMSLRNTYKNMGRFCEFQIWPQIYLGSCAGPVY